MFEKEKTPVDGYGVGSALVHGNNDFTADVVKVNGKKMAKVGRVYKHNRRLQLIRL
ncbi:MAG: Quinolinate phosphoribosyl transferase [Microgenomates group bacterium GW2011_GWA2_47_8]|nr:MAG: Quinolinate phosphoribosyl transferase [Microgenomates group bacterium GW2011_GWA2_47_8]